MACRVLAARDGVGYKKGPESLTPAHVNQPTEEPP